MMNTDSNDEYTVERILKKRIKRGVVQYYVKWLGYGEDESTWEPRDNLNCDRLIENFEKEHSARNEKNNDITIVHAVVNTSSRTNVRVKNEDPWVEDPELEGSEITDATLQGGVLCFRVKWADPNKGSDWIVAPVCNRRIPFLVLKYYENLTVDI